MIGAVWLIEWQHKSGGAEAGNTWEPDHNSGIWFTRDGAEKAMQSRLERFGGNACPYSFRITRYAPTQNGNDPIKDSDERILTPTHEPPH